MKTLLVAVLLALFCTAPAANGEGGKPLVIRAARLNPIGAGVIESGVLLVQDGRIVAMGPSVAIPEGAETLTFEGAVVTPGLIDALCVLGSDRPRSAAERPEFARRPASLWQSLASKSEHAHSDDEHVCSAACAGPRNAAEEEEMFAAAAGVGASWGEQAAEVTPHLRVLDSVDLESQDLTRLLRNGVTTIYVSPDSGQVIGAQGAIVRTGGALERRVVRAADAVKASLGADPIQRGGGNSTPRGGFAGINTRRPTTRMGVDFVFRKAFYDAKRAGDGLPLYGADQPPLAAIPALQALLRGEMPLRIQARLQHDIFSALRLAQEFGVQFVLEDAVEAYQCIPQLKTAGVSVVYGPLSMIPQGFRAAIGEANDARLATPTWLEAAGIPFALTAQELRDEEGLVRQAMIAARYGLSPAAALRAITAAPAQILKLPGFGTLEVGGPADLVVWSGDPLHPASRVQLVLIEGVVAFRE